MRKRTSITTNLPSQSSTHMTVTVWNLAKELVRGMRHVLDKYQKEEELQVVDDMLIAFTGYKLDTLLNMAEQISDDAVED